MAQDFIVNIGSDFNITEFSESFCNLYRSKGYNASSLPLENGIIITLGKDLGGINSILGLGIGIKINLFMQNNILSVSFSEEEWSSKAVAIALGLFLSAFAIPFLLIITGVIGITKQISLSKNIHNDITVILASSHKQEPPKGSAQQ